jgi:hypothetical protein
MPTALYLDTARLGRMVPRAQRSQRDFIRLCGDEGGSAHVEDFLRHGPDAWPDRLRRRYPGLADWRGVAGLKQALRDLTEAPSGTEVLLAQRSAQLMRLAARALFVRCRRVLCTDLEWPAYRAILARAGQQVRAEVVCVAVREAIFRDGIDAGEVAAWLAVEYRRRDCDGLFLSAVTYQGIRLPVEELLQALTANPPRLIAIDAAQALNHVPLRLGPSGGDIYLAGCHKWLGAGQPLGVALCPRRRSREYLTATARETALAGTMDDPLLRYTEEFDSEHGQEPMAETVSLGCLFSASAAVAAAPDDHSGRPGRCRADLGPLDESVRGTGWRPLAPHATLRSGIGLYEAERTAIRSTDPERIRGAFLDRGVALTAYPGGLIRASVPPNPWK